jgi:hypothetical protein
LDVRYEGVVQEKAEAAKNFNEAVQAGKTAFKMDKGNLKN